MRLMTSTALPHTRDSLCDLLYVLCDEDGKSLIPSAMVLREIVWINNNPIQFLARLHQLQNSVKRSAMVMLSGS